MDKAVPCGHCGSCGTAVRGFKAIVSRCIADSEKTRQEKQNINSIYIAHKEDGNGYEG